MNWIPLDRIEKLHEIKNEKGYSILFKHSSRCSISMMAKKRFEQEAILIPEETPVYFLDLINYRDISAAVTQLFDIRHESPQVLVIKDGECIFDASHGSISAAEASVHIDGV